MKRSTSDVLLTAVAPCIWGSTYVATTVGLAGFSPLTVAMLRALPAGLLLLLVVRQLPRGVWWARVAVLGALNFSVFLSLLFVAAYRLPGGVAATVTSVQPLLVLGFARLALGTAVQPVAVLAACGGAAGVALMVLTPEAALDPWGLAAGLGAAVAMAAGTVLSRRWQPPVSVLTFTAWQLTAGGVLLVPVALAFGGMPPTLTWGHGLSLAWLGLVGMAATSVLWFRGVARLPPGAVSLLLLLSPLTAIALGWALLDQSLGPWQLAGAALVVASIRAGQHAANGPGAGQRAAAGPGAGLRPAGGPPAPAPPATGRPGTGWPSRRP